MFVPHFLLLSQTERHLLICLLLFFQALKKNGDEEEIVIVEETTTTTSTTEATIQVPALTINLLRYLLLIQIAEKLTNAVSSELEAFRKLK